MCSDKRPGPRRTTLALPLDCISKSLLSDEQAIDRVRGRLIEFGDERGQEQYIYLWEQMKSVRQDLAVQIIHINNITLLHYMVYRCGRT